MQYRVNNIAKLRELDSARVPVLSQARIEGPGGYGTKFG